MKILFAGQQEDDHSKKRELKGTYSSHKFIYPFIILHHSIIPSIFPLICLCLQGFSVFYRIPCNPTEVSCRNYSDLENHKKGSLRER